MLAARPGQIADRKQDGSHVLGVQSSLTGRAWFQRVVDERLALTLEQRFQLSPAVARAMSARDINLEMAADYLAPTMRALLPNPFQLKDMQVAADRFAQAVMAGEAATVWGDYDVDGATSAALLMRFSRMVGFRMGLYVPDRAREGYGPNEKGMLALAEAGNKLVVCVDCGTAAHAPLKAAQDMALDVIVLDHHVAEINLPPAVAVVNPNRLDEPQGLGHLAAVGVTFLFIVAVNRVLREKGWYGAGRAEPDMLSLLDLVALGTVCDVVPLTGLNRGFVAQGLKKLAHAGKPGFASLADVAKLKNKPDCTTLGFTFGPRVNAGGRVGQSDLGARLLATDDEQEALALARLLEEHNIERRRLEDETVMAAERLVELEPDLPLLFVTGEGWHPGVIGIVAGRLKERYHKPTVVVTMIGDAGKASCRSVAGLDIGNLIIAARQADLVTHGGGHAMAAGFTVPREKAALLKAFLVEKIARHVETSPSVPSLLLDGLLAGTAINETLAEQLQQMQPFGTGNAEPKFALANARVTHASVVGEKHVRCTFENAGKRIEGIAFRAVDNPVGNFLLSGRGKLCHVAGRLKLDEWLTVRRVQFLIDDIAESH